MQLFKALLVTLLIGVGVFIGFVSLYFASLSGVMNRLGLVGGDMNRDVDVNQMVRGVRDLSLSATCNEFEAVWSVPQYLFSHGEARINLGFTLGYDRVVCGVQYTIHHNAERGAYTALKGLYYVRASYLELLPLVRANKALCKDDAGRKVTPWIQAYLSATGGKVHDVVDAVYTEIQQEQAHIDEVCAIDEPVQTF